MFICIAILSDVLFFSKHFPSTRTQSLPPARVAPSEMKLSICVHLRHLWIGSFSLVAAAGRAVDFYFIPAGMISFRFFFPCLFSVSLCLCVSLSPARPTHPPPLRRICAPPRSSAAISIIVVTITARPVEDAPHA